MRRRPKTYQRTDHYVLLGKLESDAVCETWRAAPLDSSAGTEAVALRRFHFIPGDAVSEVLARAGSVLPTLHGPGIAHHQQLEQTSSAVQLIHEHEGGRSLALIADRARNGEAGRLPIPEDLALAIIERIALALATTHDLQHEGSRIIHGGLLPHFVWITGDGEVRLTGQELGRAMREALQDDRAGPEVRPFLAPEVVRGDAASHLSDIYSAGTLLYLLLTGERLPECRTASQNVDRIQQSRSCLSGDPLNHGLQAILVRCVSPDPELRYGSAAELRKGITSLLQGSRSGSTTFNLAFYLHALLRRDFERERVEQEEEARAAAVSTPSPSAVATGTGTTPRKSRTAVFIAIAAVLILASGLAAAYFGFLPSRQTPAHAGTAKVVTPEVAPREALPIPSSTMGSPAASNTAIPPLLDDEAARDAAFEAAVNARLQEEMLKLQARHDEELRKQRLSQSVVPEQRATPPPAAVKQEPAVLQQEDPPEARDDVRSEPSATPAPAIQEPQPAVRAREGQLIELASVDSVPTVVRSVEPVYPPMARTRKLEATIIVSALVSETGRVLEVRIMRGDSRNIGLNEAAIAAVRSWQFTPAMKDGQRVRTWMPVAVSFKMSR